MTPDERQLIDGLFDRMRGFGAVEKDRDAEALINQAVRQMPDAPYMLVQSVLVQEHALQQADQRIRELEQRIEELEARSQPRQQSGSFLGGLFGGPRADPPSAAEGRGSVPTVGRPQSFQRPDPQSFQRPDAGAPPGSPPGGSPWAPQRGGGGGFLQSAMSTAAGVAGGMLLANSISSMLGGHSGSASASPHTTDASTGAATTEASHADAHQTAAQEPHYQDASDNDPGVEDAGYDDGGDWGGGGDDFDI
jgi:hypothetical protein